MGEHKSGVSAGSGQANRAVQEKTMILALTFGRTLTLTEASKEFRVRRQQIKQWVDNGWLQHTKTYPMRISRDELIQLMAHGVDWKGDPTSEG